MQVQNFTTAEMFGAPHTKEGKLIDISNLPISTSTVSNSVYLISIDNNVTKEIDNAVKAECAFVIFEKQQIDPITSINAFMCSSSDIEKLKVSENIELVLTEKEYRSIKLSAYSSTGPSMMGVLKPEIVAPGEEIISSKGMGYKSGVTDDTSRNTLTQKSGTSMATPAISGCLTLIRQYFMQGWYPTGKPNKDDGFIPSASLLRAAIINSAGMERNDYIGYGIPNLERGLGVLLMMLKSSQKKNKHMNLKLIMMINHC